MNKACWHGLDSSSENDQKKRGDQKKDSAQSLAVLFTS